MFSLTPSHHERRETERIVKKEKFCFKKAKFCLIFQGIKVHRGEVSLWRKVRTVYLLFVRIIYFKILLVSYNC